MQFMYKSGPELSRRDVLHIIVRVKLKYNRSEMGDVECSRGGKLIIRSLCQLFYLFCVKLQFVFMRRGLFV